MICFIRLIVSLSSVLMACLAFGAEIPTLRELEAAGERVAAITIPGAVVPTAGAATKTALARYIEKVRGILALEGPGLPSVVTLGLDVHDFGRKGDKVWEVRMSTMTSDGARALRAIVWVHAMTGKVVFLLRPSAENGSAVVSEICPYKPDPTTSSGSPDTAPEEEMRSEIEAGLPPAPQLAEANRSSEPEEAKNPGKQTQNALMIESASSETSSLGLPPQETLAQRSWWDGTGVHMLMGFVAGLSLGTTGVWLLLRRRTAG